MQLTEEQIIAINAALSISFDIEAERHDGEFLNHESVQALKDLLAAHSAGVQEPVAWAVYNGWSKIAFYISEEGARDHAKAAQRSHDLSGSLAAFRVVPLYAQPQPTTDAAREVALRLHVRRLLDFINNEGPAAKEWQAISETTERIGVLLAEIERLDSAKGE